MMKAELLSRLVLLRHDPQLVAQLQEQAEAGDPDAQYALGLVYAEGRGVDEDRIAAYVWLSRAMAQGDEDARDLRYIILQTMTTAEIAEAERQERGAQWQ